MKYQTILFDMDGTILDTLEDLQSSVNHMREKYGYPPCSLDEVRRFVGNGARVLMRRALPELMTPEREDALLEEYKAWYMAHNCVRTHPYAGIPALLEELRGAGVTTAVVSNKPHANTVVSRRGSSRACPPSASGRASPLSLRPTWSGRRSRSWGAPREGALYVGEQRGRRGNGAAQRAGSRGRLVGLSRSGAAAAGGRGAHRGQRAAAVGICALSG